jgi:hypothetical protein
MTAVFMPLQPRGEAGDVLDELLLGGSTDLLCTVENPYLDQKLQVIYTPASGELAGQECTLSPTFIEEFLDQPRRPRPDEYQLLPPLTHIIDLACASGHLSMATSMLDSEGRRRNAEHPTTPPQKHCRWGAVRARRGCGMRCGMSSMAQHGLVQAAEARHSTASEKVGQVL